MPSLWDGASTTSAMLICYNLNREYWSAVKATKGRLETGALRLSHHHIIERLGSKFRRVQPEKTPLTAELLGQGTTDDPFSH